MHDHRTGHDPTIVRDITKLVRTHSTRHPGSVKRTPKAQARATARRAKASRKANR